jgi:hypothetical protein
VDWDRVKGLVTREAARLGEGDKVEQERADALETCLRQAEQARQAPATWPRGCASGWIG